MLLKTNDKFLISRKQTGFSLAAVLAMGTITTLWATAMMSIVLPTYQKSAALRTNGVVRGLAEAGLDYAISQLNLAVRNNQIAALDASTLNQFTDTDITGLLRSKLGTDMVPSGTRITIRVENVPVPITSTIYDRQVAWLVTNKGQPNPYRMVTATCRLGNTIKNLRVLLKPEFTITLTNGTGPGQKTPIFMPFVSYGINNNIMVGQVGTNTYVPAGLNGGAHRNNWGPQIAADVGSGTTANQVGSSSGSYRGMIIGGSIYEFCNPVSAGVDAAQWTASRYNAVPVAQASWFKAMNNHYSNYPNMEGTASLPGPSGYYPRGASNDPGWRNIYGVSNRVTDEMLAHGDPNATGKNVGDWYGGALTQKQNYPKPGVPPAPSAPSGTPDLGDVLLKDSAKIVIREGANWPPVNLNDLRNATGSTTVVIPPGNYKIASLNMQGTAQIVIESGVTENSSFYFDKPTASSSTPLITTANGTDINTVGLPAVNTSNLAGSGFNLLGKAGYKDSNNQGYGGFQTASGDQHNGQLAIHDISQSAAENLPLTAEFSGSSRNLQIYCNQTGAITILGRSRATIYAPNADVTIGAQKNVLTRPAELFGAVVANMVTLISDYTGGIGNKAFLHYDLSLKPTVNQAPIDPQNPGLLGFNNLRLDRYQAVSWQEARRPAADANGIVDTSTIEWGNEKHTSQTGHQGQTGNSGGVPVTEPGQGGQSGTQIP